MNRKRIAYAIAPIIDVVLVGFVIPAAFLLRFVRHLGLSRLRLTRSVLMRIGVLPVRNHYYEPFITANDLRHSLTQERELPGIDLNEPGQLRFLSTLNFESELGQLKKPAAGLYDFKFGNDMFESGDAEYLYQVIRRFKPANVFEIGSGYSTLVARAAIKKNLEENADLKCRHLCIEPYAAPWLENTGVEVLRHRVEYVNKALFRELGKDDLLFIDSSHVIRPQGDVITEYLEILPTLRSGVVVHIHDVFTPRDYLEEWVINSVLLWNEQYLLEAFLSNNPEWTIISALNFLKHRHFDALKKVCPYLSPDREPGSFYIQKK
ncbi:MAG: class I SAM-dependent methyltransferase [Steroidobacteraceae bacterium]